MKRLTINFSDQTCDIFSDLKMPLPPALAAKLAKRGLLKVGSFFMWLWLWMFSTEVRFEVRFWSYAYFLESDNVKK